MTQPTMSEKKTNIPRKILNNVEISICVLSMIAMTGIIFVQVIGRYVFHHSLGWSEEISRFLVVWVTFGGSAYAFRKGAHIGVTALVDKMPKELKFGITMATRFITIGFFIFLLYYGAHFTADQIAAHRLAVATRLPIAIPYSAVPIGSFLVIIRLLDQTIRELKLGRILEVNEV